MSGQQRYYTLRPSRLLALSLLLLCAASLVVIWSLPLHKLVLLALSAVALSWTGYHLVLDAQLRFQHSCVAFRLEQDNIRAEVILVREGNTHRVVRCNNVKQMAAANF